MLKLTFRRAAAWRVRRQHLDRRAPAGRLIAVAARLCGLHAQLLSSAELSAWARIENLDRRAVQRALWEERTLVKTWAMRGTLHLLPACELGLWRAALGTSPRFSRPAAWQKYFGISMDQLDRLTEAIGEALTGRLLTREELGAEVARATGSAALGAKLAESSWGTLLRPAAFAGHLCFAPSSGQRVRFTHPDTWLRTSGEGVDAHIATSAVARRFFAVYGPATWHDLARWWNGGGVSIARQWVASLGDELCAVDLEGEQAWMLAEHAREIRELQPVRSVRLLPAFDPYIIAASRHARRLLPGDVRDRIYRPQGWISPVLLVNGRMEGIWRHEIRGSRVEVTIEPFLDTPAWVYRAAGQEAERLAAFLGGVLKLLWKA